MAVKYKFPTRKFLDVTQEKPDLLKMVTANIPSDAVTRIYESKDTSIIHSKSSSSNHASISNAKGYEYIEEWEFKYVVDHILNEDYTNVSMLVSSNGVIHLYANKGTTLVN